MSTSSSFIRKPRQPMLFITGQLIERKKPVDLAGIPQTGIELTETSVRAFAPGLDRVHSAFRIANKLFDTFQVSGSTEAVLAFRLMATGHGAGHKLPVPLAGEPTCEQVESAQVIVSYLQSVGRGNNLPEAWSSLGDAGERAARLVDQLADKLEQQGLVVESVHKAQGSNSHYLSVATQGRAPIVVRVSDHGQGNATHDVNLNYLSTATAALAAVLAVLGQQATVA